MHKRNTSGLLSKCRQLWRNLGRILSSLVSEDYPVSDNFANNTDKKEIKQSESVHSDSLFQLSETKEDRVDMAPVIEFFQTYIGLIAIDFKTFVASVPDLQTDIHMKMLVNVQEDDNKLLLKFEDVNKKNLTQISITPRSGGQFIERQKSIKPNQTTLYQMSFFGGHVVEYLNEDMAGGISVV